MRTSADNLAGRLAFVGAFGLCLGAYGCSIENGCLGGSDGRCVPARACQALVYPRDDDSVEVAWVGRSTPRIPGPEAALAAGDLVFQAVGILPDDSVRYLSVEVLDDPRSFVQAIAPGVLPLAINGARYGVDDQSFESFDPTLALRGFPWRGLRGELAGRFPLFGADRTDAGLALNVGWMLER